MLGQALQTLGRAFQVHDQAFKTLRGNQKLGRVFVLQHGSCCPNQPRYLRPIMVNPMLN